MAGRTLQCACSMECMHACVISMRNSRALKSGSGLHICLDSSKMLVVAYHFWKPYVSRISKETLCGVVDPERLEKPSTRAQTCRQAPASKRNLAPGVHRLPDTIERTRTKSSASMTPNGARLPLFACLLHFLAHLHVQAHQNPAQPSKTCGCVPCTNPRGINLIAGAFSGSAQDILQEAKALHHSKNHGRPFPPVSNPSATSRIFYKLTKTSQLTVSR